MRTRPKVGAQGRSRRGSTGPDVLFLSLAALAGAVALLAATGGAARGAAARSACAGPLASPAYAGKVRSALRARTDVFGRRLLHARGGPTYNRTKNVLAPLLYAAGARGKKLTDSGVYYLPFAYPFNVDGSRPFALHVADGSEIITRRVGGPSVTVDVGPKGTERYGSCLARLTTATLAEGYLPILETSYTDAAGTRYDQESFVGRAFGTISLSYVHLHVDATASTSDAVVRFVLSPGPLAPKGNQLLQHGSTRFAWGGEAAAQGRVVRFDVSAGTASDVYVAVPSGPNDGRTLQVTERTYDTARDDVADYWQSRLGEGTVYDVPDQQVVDAEQAVLVQQLLLTWRYSAGNSYEELSFAEAADAARVMAEYGRPDVAETILRFALKRLPLRFTNWRAGELMVAHAELYRLARDRTFLDAETPHLARIVHAIGRELAVSRNGLLDREPFSSDVAREVYALHGQAVTWEGLAELGRVWSVTGHPQLAARCRALAAKLHAGLLRAVRRSEVRAGDGSVFVPAALLAGERPYPNLALSRSGTYWNLVMPYALASGLFPPHGRIAEGVLHYLLAHGGRMLGLVRAGATRLYGQYPPKPTSGIDQVYGVNVDRFLADAEKPDQLVLSLYGMLGAAMTPDTFVSGESESVTPLHGKLYRTMYQPPNSGANAAFLENLRLLLVHETRGPDDAPKGLELAFSTPRQWLTDGKTISVEQAPTSFGPVSFTLARAGASLTGTVDVPSRPAPSSLALRVRLPVGEHLGAVRVDGRRAKVDRRSGTIELSGLRGHLELEAVIGR
ncbi:MAG TPA: hypothetical protein VH538_10950 [Gaiellaceae bacterium]